MSSCCDETEDTVERRLCYLRGTSLRLKKQSSIDLVVDKGAQRQLFLPVIGFPLVSAIPPVRHDYLQSHVAKLGNLPDAMLYRNRGLLGRTVTCSTT